MKLTDKTLQAEQQLEFEAWYAEHYAVDKINGKAETEQSLLQTLRRITRRPGQCYSDDVQPLWECWLNCQSDAHLMRSVATVPRDGSRFLVRSITFGFHPQLREHVPTGEHWVECWWKDGKLAQWCGNDSTSTTGSVTPVGWMPLPTSSLAAPITRAHSEPRRDFESWFIESRGVDPKDGSAMSEDTMLGILKRLPSGEYWPDVETLWGLWRTRCGQIPSGPDSPGLYYDHTLERLKELSKTIESVDGISIDGPASKITALLTCATAVPELVARIEKLERSNG